MKGVEVNYKRFRGKVVDNMRWKMKGHEVKMKGEFVLLPFISFHSLKKSFYATIIDTYELTG